MSGPVFIQLEKFEYAYVTLLEDRAEEYIDLIEEQYEGSEAVALPDIALIMKGNIPDENVLQVINDRFPAVTVEAVSAVPNPDPKLPDTYEVDLVLTVFTYSPDTELTNSINHRVASAVATLIAERRPSDIGIKFNHPVALVTAETLLAAEDQMGPYLKSARVETTLVVGSWL